MLRRWVSLIRSNSRLFSQMIFCIYCIQCLKFMIMLWLGTCREIHVLNLTQVLKYKRKVLKYKYISTAICWYLSTSTQVPKKYLSTYLSTIVLKYSSTLHLQNNFILTSPWVRQHNHSTVLMLHTLSVSQCDVVRSMFISATCKNTTSAGLIHKFTVLIGREAGSSNQSWVMMPANWHKGSDIMSQSIKMSGERHPELSSGMASRKFQP